MHAHSCVCVCVCESVVCRLTEQKSITDKVAGGERLPGVVVVVVCFICAHLIILQLILKWVSLG